MVPQIRRYLGLAGALAGMIAGRVTAAEFWVAPTGNDRNPGTQDSPLATPAGALRKARELRRVSPTPLEGGAQIWLRGGVYRLDQPLLIRPEDSGSETSPTGFAAAAGERPVLSGGVPVVGWRKLPEKIFGLPDAAQEQVWVAEVPQFNGRPLAFRQLWVNGRKTVRARTPNGDAMARLTAWDREKEEAGIPAELVAAIHNPSGLEMVLAQQWEIAVLRVKALRGEVGQVRVAFQQPESRLEFEHPWPQPILPPEGAGAFFLTNAFEFLDEPGEWHQEAATGRIFYWPRAGEDLLRAEVIAPALETLVLIAGSLDRPVSHVTFTGIGFEHTTWLRPSEVGHVPLQAGMFLTEAYKLRPKGTPDWRGLDNQAWIGRPPAGIMVRGAHHTRFERCRFERMAMTGLDFVSGTRDDAVEGCVFRDLGGNGLQLGAFQSGGIETHLPYAPADEREICTREKIANNLVTDCANEDWGGVGICAGYVRDTVIEHNEVSHVSYTGISLGWGWTRTKNAMRDNRVHANRLHHIGTRLCDTAGIYTLSAQPGTVISENCVEEIKMSPFVDRPQHWFYLYTDEGSSFITVRDNWCPEGKFLQNANGPGNVWERNGPQVPASIKDAAGLEPAFRDLGTGDGEREAGGDRGIDGLAALLEDRDAGLGGEVVR